MIKDDSEIEKVKRNGKVAVLYSSGYGAGWSTWSDASYAEVLLFHPRIVELVEQGRRDEITEDLCKALVDLKEEDYICVIGASGLEIMWIEEGAQFEIKEYDGSEDIHVIGSREYFTA